MAKTRLTRTMREKILTATLAHAFRDEIEAHMIKASGLACDIYDDVFGKDIEKMNALPDGWMPTTSDVMIQFEAGDGVVRTDTARMSFVSDTTGFEVHRFGRERTIFETIVFDIIIQHNRAADDKKERRRRIPEARKNLVLRAYEPRTPLHARYVSLKSGGKALQDRFEEASMKAQSVLMDGNVKTIEALIEIWPEIESIAKEHIPAPKKASLPDVPRDDLNAKLRLPKEEKEAA